MKIKLTTTEAHTIIRTYLNLAAEVEVTITKARTKVDKIDRLIPNLANMIRDIDRLDINGGDKIPAIKRFRETIDCGLAEAKWVIENWSKVKSFIIKNNRRPEFVGHYGSGTLNIF